MRAFGTINLKNLQEKKHSGYRKCQVCGDIRNRTALRKYINNRLLCCFKCFIKCKKSIKPPTEEKDHVD